MVGTDRRGCRLARAIGAAAAVCAAGSAAGQQGWWDQYERGAQRAEDRPAMREGGAARETVYIYHEAGGREVVVRLRGGRVAARLDGRAVPRDRVEVRGDRVRVLDENRETIAAVPIPEEAMRQARMDRERRGFRSAQAPEPMDEMPGEGTTRFRFQEPWFEELAELLRGGVQGFEQPDVVVGILMEPVPPDALGDVEGFEGGVRVARTIEDLPAAEAGLREGDIIVELDGDPTPDADAVRRGLRGRSPGETVTFTVVRDGDEREVEVTLERFDPSSLNWDFVSPPMREEWPPARQRPESELGEADQAGRPVLGVSISEAPEEAFAEVEGYDSGVVVQELREGLPAAKAGLKEGDIIVEFDGQRVASPTAVQELVAKAEPGGAVELTIIRDGQVRKLSVPLGRRE